MKVRDLDAERIRQVEMDFFQGREEQAVKAAVEIVATLDMDDDDEARAAANLMARALGAETAESFITGLEETGFDFSVRLPDGETLVTMYVSRGGSNPAVLRLLSDAGADLLSCNRAGSNALHILASFEKSNWAKEREIDMAAIAGIPAEVSGWMVCNAYGATPLHFAVMNRHRELVAALLELGADADAKGSEVRQGYGHAISFDGLTPLDVAGIVGNDEAAFLLLDHGANPMAADNSGRVAAHFTVSPPPISICREWDSVQGMDAIVNRKKAILARIGGLDVADDLGTTPLTLSLTSYRYQNGGLSETLLEFGADPNISMNDGTTPLIAAVSNGHGSAVKALIAAGANLDVCDSHGRTALHHAISWRDEKSSRLLVKKGAKFDIPDEKGVTAGDMAASAGMESVMELMV